MKPVTTTVTVPQTNVNDDSVTLVEWMEADGAVVKKGQAIVAVESSKTVLEIEAETAGVLRHLASLNDEVAIGNPIARIEVPANGEALILPSVRQGDQAKPEMESGKESIKATHQARDLAEEHGVDLTQLSVKGIITARHVQRYLAESDTAPAPPAK
ncbi:MAG: hypothetical protein HQL50_16400, partial [Magnetococcales bacterium]|nr:hypothetical protein [Magnetococcales bacterium]